MELEDLKNSATKILERMRSSLLDYARMANDPTRGGNPVYFITLKVERNFAICSADTEFKRPFMVDPSFMKDLRSATPENAYPLIFSFRVFLNKDQDTPNLRVPDISLRDMQFSGISFYHCNGSPVNDLAFALHKLHLVQKIAEATQCEKGIQREFGVIIGDQSVNLLAESKNDAFLKYLSIYYVTGKGLSDLLAGNEDEIASTMRILKDIKIIDSAEVSPVEILSWLRDRDTTPEFSDI